MLTNPIVPNGVVLGGPLAEAFLHCAVKEGLLDDDPTIGDGFVRRILATPPSTETFKIVREQLVLGGKIFVPFELPSDWKGELIERGTVQHVDRQPEEKLVEVPRISSDVMLGMLKSRGHAWTPRKLDRCYRNFLKAYGDWDALKGGQSFEGLEISRALHAGMPNSFPDPDAQYSAPQLQAWTKLQAEYQKVAPAAQCHESFRRVLTASMMNRALSCVRIAQVPASTISVGQDRELVGQSVLLKIACKELSRVSFGTTLRETIKVAESAEAQALREKLTEWSQILRRGEVEPTELVIKEIAAARKALTGAKRLAQFGEYSTWLSVPMGAATALLSLSPNVGEAVGLSAAAMGTIALARQKTIESENAWAMFG